VAKPATEPSFADEALTDVELSFFERGIMSAPDVSTIVIAEPSPLIADDVDSLLTPEQQERRQWFRRKVTALMAGMGALATAAIAIRLASLL
jgi:hypothetical protein